MGTSGSLMRITPIYMGSTPVSHHFWQPQRDHPHIHGEHPAPLIRLMIVLGSPPYTWGAHIFHFYTSERERITPIYMGSTVIPVVLLGHSEDHPHIHGEHTRLCGSCDGLLGSPPYTWGAHSVSKFTPGVLGITPIYMGSTSL